MADEPRTEVTLTGHLNYDARLRLYNLHIETFDDGEYGCLDLSFDLDHPDDAEFCAMLQELLVPPPLDEP